MKLIPRIEARKLKLKRFFTGRPCKYGHFSERWVRSGHCLECNSVYQSSTKGKKERRQRRYRMTPENRAEYLLSRARVSSKKRGHPPPTIKIRDLLPSLTRGTCDLTGLPFEPDPGVLKRRSPYTPSIDRIDSSKPYTKKNFRVVLWAINSGCGTWGLETYLKIASAVKR